VQDRLGAGNWMPSSVACWGKYVTPAHPISRSSVAEARSRHQPCSGYAKKNW
jgi:hypothetical protein